MPQFHLQSGSRAGEVIELTGEIITIGSAPGNMIELDGEDVEPFHATLVADEGDYVLCDQQSGAGTFVNGVRIGEQKLIAGDQVFIGSVPMLYASEIPRPAAAAPQEFPPVAAPAESAPAHARETLLWAGLAGLLAIVAAVAGYALLHRPPGQAESPQAASGAATAATTAQGAAPASASDGPPATTAQAAAVPPAEVAATLVRSLITEPKPPVPPAPPTTPVPPSTPAPAIAARDAGGLPAVPGSAAPGAAVGARGTGSPAPDPLAGGKGAPFVNSLGMKFLPVAGTKVLFSVWETRVQDYEIFARETGLAWKRRYFWQGPDHPAVNVNWEDAKAFCAWLSKKEGREYRLPTDHEWSVAVGIGAEERATDTPEAKHNKIAGYPWGKVWPPPRGAGNFSSYLKQDDIDHTARVGSFAANGIGLYDLSGNAWEWCEDWSNSNRICRVLRGGSLADIHEIGLRSSYRGFLPPAYFSDYYGFRCVLVISGS